ncbi:hypothetical protein B0H11DRAFT_2194790 [Mycena galericulata]|nr:hypothetical protein B0H11DRAFT_2194790 [Mycena galericulata]
MWGRSGRKFGNSANLACANPDKFGPEQPTSVPTNGPPWEQAFVGTIRGPGTCRHRMLITIKEEYELCLGRILIDHNLKTALALQIQVVNGNVCSDAGLDINFVSVPSDAQIDVDDFPAQTASPNVRGVKSDADQLVILF